MNDSGQGDTDRKAAGSHSVPVRILAACGHAAKRRPVTALVLLVAAGIGIAHIGDVVTYSDGLEAGRRGVIVKLSHKGIFPCTSWEGQLAMEGFRGGDKGSTNVFEFSIRDPKARDLALEAYKSGATVQIGYIQTFTHWSCLRATDYWADRITVVGSGQK
jgi:hypothetical protein